MQLLSAISELLKVSKGVKTHETFPPQWGNNCKRNKTLYNNVNDSERIELRYSKSAIPVMQKMLKLKLHITNLHIFLFCFLGTW